MNNLYIVGRLTKEPETKETKTGAKIVSATIAVNRQFKNANGETETDFIPVKIFGTSGEYLAKYTHKGDLIGIRGSLQTGSYEKDGQKIYTMDVVADKVTFLASKKEDNKETKKVEDDPFAAMGDRIDNEMLD